MVDGLPSKICADCWDQCSKWALFKDQCRKTDATLRCLLFQNVTPTRTSPRSKEPVQNEQAKGGDLEILLIAQDEHANVPRDEEETFPEFLAIKDDDEMDVASDHSALEDTTPADIIMGDEEDTVEPEPTTGEKKSKKREVPAKVVGGSKEALVCSIATCGKKFRKENMLEAHMREHAGKKVQSYHG